MRMSTKGRVAVNAMIDLALRERSGPVALATIARRQGVSLSYLEQLFAGLRRAGLVESTRGPGGGYTLGRPMAAVSVADIVDSVSEPEVDAPREAADEALRALWEGLDTVMRRHLGTITLRSLVDDQIAAGVVLPTREPARRLPAPAVSRPLATRAPNSVFAFGQSFAR